jgi:hypothetical protein
MDEYSIEWFKYLKKVNSKWLGAQALKLLEHYEALEAENERVHEDVGRAARLLVDGQWEEPMKTLCDIAGLHYPAIETELKPTSVEDALKAGDG